MEISPDGKREALSLARWALEWTIKGNHVQSPNLTSKLFEEKQGLFVTLRRAGELRGCVGRVEPLAALKEEIPELALSAATRDPRFPTVSSQEVDDLNIEISILSPPNPVDDMEQIKIGTHGLIIERDQYRGLLLPQVAVEEEWDVTRFLEHACLKAALPTDAWKEPDVHIYRFSALVFAE
ncbi:MAG: AmmeMemoRadiSam system protein A [Fidelibacterota bacterium]